jgi:hypothetical protein
MSQVVDGDGLIQVDTEAATPLRHFAVGKG